MSADFKKSVDRFLRKISGPSPENLFNPWRDRDPQLDLAKGPAIRRSNLRQYLLAHEGAQAILVGEAAGGRDRETARSVQCLSLRDRMTVYTLLYYNSDTTGHES